MNLAKRKARPIEVLMVEDNPADVLLTREAFAQSDIPASLHQVSNGQECMDFLRQTGAYQEVPRPDMVLLDLNMPLMDGREVLRQIVDDEKLKDLLVVVLTTSSAPDDLRNMYRLRCNSYIVKPLDFSAFQEAIRAMYDYWFSLAELPKTA